MVSQYQNFSHLSSFFPRPRLNWRHMGEIKLAPVCFDKCVDECRSVGKAGLHHSQYVLVGFVAKTSLSVTTDWTVVTLKCFSPVGPFCSGESEIWAVELSKYKSISRQIRMTLTWWLTPWDDTRVTCATQSSSGPRLIIKRNHWVVQQSRTQFFWEIRFFSYELPPHTSSWCFLCTGRLNPRMHSDPKIL